MLSIKEYITPQSLDEAYSILTENRFNRILGGCCFLNLCSARINKAIDLNLLNMSYIKEDDENIYIGSDTILRDIEMSPLVKKHFSFLCDAISCIISVSFRNMARIGGSVFSKYGFSDIIPNLIVLNSQVKLHNQGIIELKDFLYQKYEKDILVEVIIPKLNGIGHYEYMRKSSVDFPILNASIYIEENKNIMMAIGSRPTKAQIPINTLNIINSEKKFDDESIEKYSDMITKEIILGNNTRSSKEYRKHICKNITKRLLSTVGEY